ncbi:O-antigen/teichoic acid export membrane protein [Flavobacterium arsenatis]|uniref:O-antigen/teichoic acid export membrane protein n=1 Tax=Flavobacterium arsenatis TaxID=1484332 RepID=A0ABU1TS95_9FLAO|nr:oligosaccharide flippase family protein [Flavobacterium arsenatis]MDR6968747.1 O-antigen/teichoic acid export membrane protein [Flavobacterium arsenatis]
MHQLLKKILFHKQFQKLSIYGFGQLFNLVTPLLVIPYIVSVCGEENFGKSAVGMAIAFFLIVFVDFGSDIIGVRDVAVNRDNSEILNKIFTTTYLVKAIILIAVLVITSIIFFSFPYFQSERQMFFLGLLVLVGQFINPTWFLQGIENVKWITVLNIISKTIYLFGIFITIKKESDYIYINMWWGIGMIVSNTLMFILVLRKHQFSFLSVNKSDVVHHIRKDFSMFSSQIFVSLQLYAPVVLISYFGNNLMAGQYRIVEQIIVIFKTYIFLFFNYVFPKVCYLIEIDYKKGIKNWLIYNGANLILIAIGMVFLYTFSYEIVSYFNPTNRYILSNLLQVAVFIPLILAISIPLKQLILALNYKLFYVKLTSIMVVINLITIVVLLPKLQVYGVFYSLIATDLIVIIFYLYQLKKTQKLL